MMKQYWLSLMLTAALAWGCSFAQEPADTSDTEQIAQAGAEEQVEQYDEIFRPEYADLIARHRQGEINIDGQLDESDWQAAEQTSSFTEPINNENSVPVQNDPQYQTRARILWDENHLYFGFEAMNPEEPHASFTSHDEPLHNQDVVEVFLDIKGDMMEYAEYQASPKGITADYYHVWDEPPQFSAEQIDWPFENEKHTGSIDWNAKNYQAAAAPLVIGGKTRGFSVEMVIPVSEILEKRNLPPTLSDGQGFQVNLVRYIHTRVGRSAMRKMQQLNWGPVLKGCPHVSPMAMRPVRCKRPANPSSHKPGRRNNAGL